MNRFLFSFALIASLLAISCEKPLEEDIVVPENIDGVWVEAFKNISDGQGSCVILSIAGEQGDVCVAKMDGRGLFLSSRSSATVAYDNIEGMGTISPKAGNYPDISFAIGSSGLMFTSEHRILVHYDRTLEEMFNQNTPPVIFSPEIDGEFEGPSEFSLGTSVPPPSLLASFFDWLGPIVARSAATYGCTELYKMIFSSAESDRISEVIAAIEDVNKRLDELTELYHNTTYESYLNKRSNDYVAPLKNYTDEYYLRLVNCDGSEDAIKEIVLEWGDGYIGGNKACDQYLNFVDFLTGSIVEQKNLYAIYDLYVYNTTPWEAQGYAFREGIRSSDLAVVAQNALLASLYYRVREGLDDRSRETLLGKIETYVTKYQEFSEANPVVRHDDLAVCQIKGAKFVMKKDLIIRDYYNKPWYPNGSEWDNEYNDNAWFVVYGDTKYNCAEMYDKCLSPEEINTLAKYYKSSQITTFAQILKDEAGCVFPSSFDGKTPVMLAQGDGAVRHFEYDDYYISATDAVLVNSTCSVTSQDIGIAYLEHYGFLWMKQRFSFWTSNFNRNRIWFCTDVVERY